MEEKDWPVLKGERCTLAVLSLEDAEAWKAGEDEDFEGQAERWEYDESGPCVRYVLHAPERHSEAT